MVMVFPFLTGALAICYGILGKRPACFVLWLLTLALFAGWTVQHLHGRAPLPLAL